MGLGMASSVMDPWASSDQVFKEWAGSSLARLFHGLLKGRAGPALNDLTKSNDILPLKAANQLFNNLI